MYHIDIHIKVVDLFANIGDPDHTPRFSASELGLQCFPVTRLGSPVFKGSNEIDLFSNRAILVYM